MPTIGALSRLPPVEPKNFAWPNVKMPPSRAKSQYPLPVLVGVSPSTGELRCMAPVEPKNFASPKQNTPPSPATSQ